ncbi:PREDICTED: WD repeat domain phosphoinositide-interacting protein 2-like isoform X2 [Nicrophorus vespilloides]|uniref:WD repeat domain phosphoinositide-interacting protein 2-like isoform X2 n=1 Tax=Nicrophorus vespilloides TaxID=110193 RepID=A0ABM1M9N3_NICVS|nr:PREDICTED: WD repeat domain phosphoinositide-interacting protein 2-like isoform X2 [Nicrophorus vespilloides]
MTNVNNASSSSNTPLTYFVNFNQDSTSLAVACKNGFRLYSLNCADTLDMIYTNIKDDTCLVERLFSSSLMAIVSITAPRKLKVCHFKKGSEICNYSYSNTILSVKLNRIRLVVCLEESLYIHNIRDMKVLHTIRDTPPNPNGICALSINSDNCYLAYPGSNYIGEVQIFDAINLHAKTMIPAHDSPLAALAFIPSGTRIATASEKGTVIRVFSVLDGSKLYEFRRGVKRCVEISCLAFSTCSRYLACSSNTETVHIFKLEEPQVSPRKSVDASWMGYLSTYLPTQVTDVFTQGRACMTAHLPFSGVRNDVAVTTIQNQLRLLVATEEGFLYIYNMDGPEGTELTLYKQFSLDGVANNADGTRPEPQFLMENEGSTILGSYAGIVKGHPPGQMSESDKFREMAVATESPPKDGFQFTDDQEYPPLTQNSD